MPVLLAVISALAYGVTSFLGGYFSRRSSAWRVAACGQISSCGCIALLSVFLRGTAAPSDWAMSAFAGLGCGFGAFHLYRGMAFGTMSLVAPVSAVGASVLPVAVGMLLGESHSMGVILGICLSLAATWLIATGRSRQMRAGSVGLGHGLLAGLGFGIYYVFIGRLSPGAGFLPLSCALLVSGLTVVFSAVALGQGWLPRDRWSRLGATTGPISALAGVCFMLSAQAGGLSIGSAIVGLYPACTVALAVIFLGERIRSVQGLGMLFATAGIALLAHPHL